MHLFKVYHLMNFDKYIHLRSHRLGQVIISMTLPNFLVSLCCQSPPLNV